MELKGERFGNSMKTLNNTIVTFARLCNRYPHIRFETV